MTPTTAETPKTLKQEILTNLYVMYYRHGMNPQLNKVFRHNGDMASAVLRARKHCEIMGYRYIFLRPFIIDIESEEDYKRSHGGELYKE